jgi:hypothetical protein
VKIFGVPIKIDDSARVIPISFPPKKVDVERIIPETEEYSN